MSILFKRVELEDQELIKAYLSKQYSRSCECTFSCIYLWSRFYNVEFAIVEKMLVFKVGAGKDSFFDFPYGSRENIPAAIKALKEYCRDKGREFVLGLVTPENFAKLDNIYPGVFEIEYNRDVADYVYEREKLANLSGKKYHGKKNHVNKFKKTYENWTYETMSKDNIEDCFQMALVWRARNEVDNDDEKRAEMAFTMNSLRLFEELQLMGGLLRVDGKVVAFTIAEPVTKDTLVVHVEKALVEYEGAYPMINQQFILHETEGYQYINREDDVGEPGLRQAKLSYHPVFMVEKGIVRYKNTQ